MSLPTPATQPDEKPGVFIDVLAPRALHLAQSPQEGLVLTRLSYEDIDAYERRNWQPSLCLGLLVLILAALGTLFLLFLLIPDAVRVLLPDRLIGCNHQA
ncbi:hypothetical protein K488DRAFT_83531 [Vararia minispora EC-137]|uniref:Uncharacterized protein n=1 Tax=Vararia minispora EC-137 TaxID=1314806 RepID=A0ACB8QSR0_9AGAM|nr:hypothetical protein K488DRAFT_83531 [Vararia minispora EC-137]